MSHASIVASCHNDEDIYLDVYQMQLTNEPAEELAKVLVESGKGAFAQCGFVSGGSEAMEAAIKLARQVGVSLICTDSSHSDLYCTVLLRNRPETAS